MIKFEVTNRWTGKVQFVAEIDCDESASHSIKLGLAVQWGVKARANLTGANLAGANLARAYLAGANLAGANLAGANLAGANLARANLAGANLTDAYLTGANLTDAYLTGAKWCDGVPLTRNPIQLFGLTWPVTILDAHMQIGCECHRLCEWESFDNDRIARMDVRQARKFWDAHRDTLLALARADGRNFSPVAVEEAA